MDAKRQPQVRPSSPPQTAGSLLRKGKIRSGVLAVCLSGLAVVLLGGVVKNNDLLDGISVVQEGPVAGLSLTERHSSAEAATDSSPSWLPLALVHVAAVPITADFGAERHETPQKAGDVPPELPSAAAELSFGVGDKLKIVFYERVDVEEDKWGRATSALRSIQQRPELSGEYAVEEDGKISIPLLGSVSVVNQSAQQVHDAIVEAFEHLLGRKGMVNVALLERAPIYVLGTVKNPGSFKYVAGATVLHAIALAGGIDRGAGDPWQKVEAVREIQKRSGAAGTTMKLIARDAVLKAERDKTDPKIPLRLVELAGVTEATSLVNEQRDRRKTVTRARKDREQAILSAVEAAKQDLLQYGHTASLDELVKTRQERVENTRVLVERNIVSKSVLGQAESELSDAEQRRQDALNQYGMAKQRLASLTAEGLRVQADLANDLATEIEAVERQIAESEREFSTSEGILRNLPGTRAAFVTSKDANAMTYQIVRRTAAGPVSIAASGMTLLQPGDLVNITVGANEMTDLPERRASTVPAVTREDAAPVADDVGRQKTGHSIVQD
jgi:polysaccharide biosynthesis/export protein ExoF